MASTHIRANGAGSARVRSGGTGGHVAMGAGNGFSARYVPSGKWDVVIYDHPGGRSGLAKSNNPGLAAALRSDQMAAVVEDYTRRVAATYRTMLEARSKSGNLAATIDARIIPDAGYASDRWIGEVTVGDAANPYGAADEFGRKSPDEDQRGSTTSGSRDLRTALYSVLPYPL